MKLLEYPYIFLTILGFCFIILTAIGIYFAVRGAKTANGKEDKHFTNISKLETIFEKSGKLKEERCILYGQVSLDNFRSLYSAAQTAALFSEIKAVLLDCFSVENRSNIAICGEKNFVVISKWTIETARAEAESCFDKLNKCLLKYAALNIVDIRIGAFFAFGTQLSFDDAMARAKQAYVLAKNENLSYAEWNISGGKALEKKIKIENNIENEIENNRFFLEYQPILEAKTKKIIGAEVLSRLNSESEGVLTPSSFLSAVSSVGLNDKFDYYIFEKNCKWISNDKKHRECYKYTVNFSRATLCDEEFAKQVIEIVEKYGLDFACLAVEILEDKNITGEERDRMIQNLSLLKEKGVSILLDDFGSGYTGFGDLQSLDISVVKIDKTITRNAVTETGLIILKNIIRTAQDIGLKTLCEGVETKEQEEAVIQAGSNFLQGFYYYKPMPVAQLEKVFNENGYTGV